MKTKVTRDKLLEIFQKASDNGWSPNSLQHNTWLSLQDKRITLLDEDASSIRDLVSVDSIIFDMHFAIALWGIDLIPNHWYATVEEKGEWVKYYTTSPAWTKHLQHMVISEDSLSYLLENA